ncbi:hypothetical protein PRZ48_013160 [Zasmidium cellare]|uniref:AB hydrolase-1 domain-containing protein n=1 Tax=Zasmidium cellare TaxID=395010 RepID=A0ABR0E393_ZASCE|nr:hypothetical protein PRZ48_013160 [Zasmidium cellare]
MPHLERPGAKIWHESVGEGPLLLCISGGDGSVDIWRMFANALKEKFTVVMWDRRGFSRSPLTSTQDYANRLSTDVSDAAALIAHYSPSTPATVIGNSSGAIIALRLLTTHPTLLRTCISYEPPLASILPDRSALQTEHQAVYALYRSSGPFPALERFAKLTQANQQNLKNIINFERPYMFSNMTYWFEREFLAYPFAEVGLGELEGVKGKLVLVCGEETVRGAYQYRANERLGEVLGLVVEGVPGEHVAHLTHAGEAAAKLVEILKARDGEFYGKL